ncbi:acyl carrier protein [Dacryopinax primogenitus]|uniref:Acyl carrier protein n=1 Tax=Dacryopinax primogenitus (strain DJM 731) TaxID=1858805 RepID=M5FW21_DACPD|nr:acyl carrier protein [Dacryopinax primogenitus]EJT99844.1 acyl carrier protein [Dacryopinax primogenitus]
MSFTRSVRIPLRSLPRTIYRTSPLLSLARPLSLPQQQQHRLPIVPLARSYSAAGLSKDEITARVLEVLKSFEKVDSSKLATNSTFTTDLGLDSLDAVEVVMAVEEEFSIEIPDAEADAITTVQEAIDYIAKTPEGAPSLPSPTYNTDTFFLSLAI